MNWLINFIDRLFCFIPRPWIVEPDESGIRITWGNRVKDCPPGWYLWWPLFQVVQKIVVVPQVVDLRSQSIKTKDNHSIIVSAAIQYKVVEVRKTLLNVYDYDKSIQTLALGVIAEYVKNRTLEECQDFAAIREEIRKSVVDTMGNWGLKIQNIYITDLDEAKTIRVLTNDSAQTFMPIEELSNV